MFAIYVIAALFGALAVLNLVVGRLPRRPEAGGGIIETANGPIHYLETVGEGTPIVFIHGMPGNARDFDRVRAELPGRHTIAFDRPGYAWSEGAPQDFGEQLDAIVEAAGTLGVERAVVVGHSFGGLATLGLAIRKPDFVESMLLLAPAAGGTRILESREKQARLIRSIERPGLCQVLDLIFLRILRKFAAKQGAAFAYGDDPELAPERRIAVSVLARHSSVRALANDRLLFNDTERMITRNLKRISAPSLILHGRQDQTVGLKNARRLAEGLTHATITEIEGDHQLPSKHPNQVVDALGRLLARTSDSAAYAPQ
ncbi:MAG: alpha/beta hydrolase [Thermoleophilaceae bacterium]|nr:alpha/beta hydrolase [Thermoleophilaceae bacterium]